MIVRIKRYLRLLKAHAGVPEVFELNRSEFYGYLGALYDHNIITPQQLYKYIKEVSKISQENPKKKSSYYPNADVDGMITYTDEPKYSG